MNIVIRECLKEDLPDVLRLIQAAFAEQKGVVDPPSSAERQVLEGLEKDLETSSILIAQDNSSSEIVGCVILKPKDESLYIGKLSVSPNRRSEGIAFKLMKQAEEIAIENGFRSLLLSVRLVLVEQQAYYERFGFKEVSLGTHEGFSEPTFINMEKVL